MLVALRKWEVFILRDKAGQLYSILIVPLGREWLQPITWDLKRAELRRDESVKGKIKVLPLAGSASSDPSGGGLRWVTLPEHAELVRWWNEAPPARN
jgi:hypothetical protein